MWDLTYAISEDMLLYPGVPQPVLHDFATPAKDGYGMSEYTFWNHLGTHIDAPTHFYAQGQSLDQFPLDAFFKRVHTVHCEDVTEITPVFLERALSQHNPGDAVFLLTGQFQYWGTPKYFASFPVLSVAGAEYLISRQAAMILVDAPSIDLVETQDFPIHHQLLRHPILIVENLAYQPDLPETFQIMALPMKIHNSNGAPARIVAQL